MKRENEIVDEVYAAREDREAEDILLRKYLPFIKSETAKFLKRPPREAEDDELSIAMFAFHEAVLGYSRLRGAFLHYAAMLIRNRLIDYYRKERRHLHVISLENGEEYGDGEVRTIMDKLDTGTNEVEELHRREAAKEEIDAFAKDLAAFDLQLTDIAENCPKQARTLAACHKALTYARENRELLDSLVSTGKLPIGRLAEGAGVERKTLERHRKYMVAVLLAYTNGFEIIRGHLYQIVPQKGE